MEETSEKTPSRPRYANALTPQMAAAVNGLWRFASQQAAVEKLKRITSAVVVVKQEEPDETQVTLWLHNFELTPEEEQKGYLGHYATLRVEAIKGDEDGHYTIIAEKLERPLKNHPLRKRTAARCPNWGHPILRAIQKGKNYPTVEAAQADLTALQLEYPETTIPAANKLYLMIFSRRETPEQPIKKYVLEIKNLQGGGFTMEWRENDHKPRATTAKTEEKKAEAPAATGHFSSMVALKRNKRKPAG